MITVFTHAGSERAFDAGFQSIKFASYDCASYPLIERVAKYAKEIIVSTGATPWRDVTKTASKLRALSDDGIIVGILHARTVYPATPKDAGLARMLALNSFGLPTGFSDHSMPMQDGVLATKFALFLGANIIERHFTILPRDETKDGPVSVNEQDSISINTFSKLNKADQLLNLGADFSKIGTYLSIESLEPTEQEFVNAKYYRGRVASMIGNHRIYGWESIDSAD
jgi:sialic acid synthase SpsE